MQADLSHCPFSVPNRKKTLLPVGVKLFSFLPLKMGRTIWKNHDGSLFTQKMLTKQEPKNYLMVVRGNRIGKEGQQ